jgi:hypothetical protein
VRKQNNDYAAPIARNDRVRVCVPTDTLTTNAPDPWFGTKVKTIVLANEGEFWVWLSRNDETSTDDVWWRTADDIPREIAPIVAREATLEAIRLNALEQSDRDAFRLLLANGIGRALDGDLAGAQATLDYAEKFVRQRLEEAARHWYLCVSIVGGLASAIAMIITFIAVHTVGPHRGGSWSSALYGVGMGIVGAAVSLISRTGTFSADPAAGRKLHMMEASARLAIGGVAGFIAFLGVRVGLLSPKFVNGDSLALMLVAFAAGYSERFIAQMTQSLESATNPKPTSPQPPSSSQ